eukprot:jgi/Tetstr1/437456/TSEL_026135.t1
MLARRAPRAARLLAIICVMALATGAAGRGSSSGGWRSTMRMRRRAGPAAAALASPASIAAGAANCSVLLATVLVLPPATAPTAPPLQQLRMMFASARQAYAGVALPGGGRLCTAVLTDAHSDVSAGDVDAVARVLKFPEAWRQRPGELRANFFHRCGKLAAFQAYLDLLLAGAAAGARLPHVALVDSDMLFAAPVLAPFQRDFDLGLTFRRLRMPGPGKEFNTGVMLAHGGRLDATAALLRVVNSELCPALPDFELNDQYVWSIITNLDKLGRGEVSAALDLMGRGAHHVARRGTLRGFRGGPACWGTHVGGRAFRLLLLDAAVYNTMFLPHLTILPGGRIMQLGKGRYECHLISVNSKVFHFTGSQRKPYMARMHDIQRARGAAALAHVAAQACGMPSALRAVDDSRSLPSLERCPPREGMLAWVDT